MLRIIIIINEGNCYLDILLFKYHNLVNILLLLYILNDESQ